MHNTVQSLGETPRRTWRSTIKNCRPRHPAGTLLQKRGAKERPREKRQVGHTSMTHAVIGQWCSSGLSVCIPRRSSESISSASISIRRTSAMRQSASSRFVVSNVDIRLSRSRSTASIALRSCKHGDKNHFVVSKLADDVPFH